MSTCRPPLLDGTFVQVAAPSIPAGCTQAIAPPTWIQAQQAADNALRSQCGRGISPATTFPYSYVVGSGSQGGICSRCAPWDYWNADTDCNVALVGSTTDCPTPAGQPGACLFTPQPLIDSTTCGATDSGECPIFEILCNKLVYDASFKTDCCMGKVTGLSNFSTPALDAAGVGPTVLPTDQVVCAPSWCPADPAGSCEDVFAVQCAGSVSNDGGATWVSALLDKSAGSACAAWYESALAGQAGPGAWPAIETIIETYCSSHIDDQASCACFLYSGGADGLGVCDSGNCYLYTSVSADSVRPVRPVDPLTSNTLNLSDYACTAPACRNGSLLPTDVWAMQHLGRCPDVCMQVVTDGTVIVNNDGDIVGGIYIDINSVACGGALASATVAAPTLMDATDRINTLWPHYTECPTCCPGNNCMQSIPLYYALAPGSADMTYTVTFNPPLPPGVRVAEPGILAGTLSWNGTPDVNVELLLEGLDMPPARYISTVTIAETRPQYATSRASTVFSLLVYETGTPAPPQGPPAPNGGQGPPVIVESVDPWWLHLALYAALAVAALLLLRQLIVGLQLGSVKRALRAQGAAVNAVEAAQTELLAATRAQATWQATQQKKWPTFGGAT